MTVVAVVTDPTVTPDYAGQLCRCGVCGLESVCAPRNDYYVRPGESWLRCEACVCTGRMPEGWEAGS